MRRNTGSLPKLKRRMAKDAVRPSDVRDAAIRRAILSIPKGKVATYGEVAAAAGYPLYHRTVARVLRGAPAGSLPWQRVIGAGGEIKVPLGGAAEQRLILQMEGVTFSGKRVNMKLHQHTFKTWEL